MSDRELILHLAKLSRLVLKDEEVESFSKQIPEILAYVHKLKSVEIPAAPSEVDASASLRRDDEVVPADREQILKQAPQRHTEFWRVPSVK